MPATYGHTRSHGTGVIRRASKNRAGWQAFGPQKGGKKGPYLGHFDTYGQAERAITFFLERAKVA